MATAESTAVHAAQGGAADRLPSRVGTPKDGYEVAFCEVWTAGGSPRTDVTLSLFTLPPGKIQVYPSLSRIIASDMAANADLHVGHAAYTDPSSAAPTVAAVVNKWADNLDAGGGAIDAALTGKEGEVFHSTDGVTVTALIDTGNIEAADTIQAWMVYRRID